MIDTLISVLICVLLPIALGILLGVGGFFLGGLITIPVGTMLLVSDSNARCKENNPPIRPSVTYSQDSSVKILKYQFDSVVQNKYIERGTKDFYIPDSMYSLCPCSGTVTIKGSK